MLIPSIEELELALAGAGLGCSIKPRLGGRGQLEEACTNTRLTLEGVRDKGNYLRSNRQHTERSKKLVEMGQGEPRDEFGLM
jgi:hypothetical protein